jgi:hypothetical protein
VCARVADAYTVHIATEYIRVVIPPRQLCARSRDSIDVEDSSNVSDGEAERQLRKLE